MKRIVMIVAGLIFSGTGAASIELPEPPEISLEISQGTFYNQNSDLVLLGYTESAATFLGQKSYQQINIGAWDGPISASIVGVARGVQWDKGNGSFIRLSTGTSVISDTSYRLSTAFQFYEQFLIQKNVGNMSFSVSYRHWSNAFIKRPNHGMDFLGGHLEYKW